MFEMLLDNQLDTLCAVFLEHEANLYRLDDSLILKLSTGQMFQLLVDQTNKVLRAMSDESDIALFGEYSPEDRAVLEVIPTEYGTFEGPLSIREILEYWANDGKQDFLMGVVLADPVNRKGLSILTGGTEVEVVTSDVFRTVIQELPFTCRVVRLVSSSPTETE